MAQPVQQAALRAPGFEGLNTELSPINGDPEFALVADNVVVDQIGRLLSRKAFADFRSLTDQLPTTKSAPVTTNTGFYPAGKRGWDFINNEIQITTEDGGQCYIQPLELDAIDPDIDIQKLFVKISVSFKDFTGFWQTGSPDYSFPYALGQIYFYQVYQGRQQLFPIYPTDLLCDHQREDEADRYRWSYQSTIGTVTYDFQIVPYLPLYVVWDVHPDFPKTNMPLQIRVRLDEITMEGLTLSERGRNELITLGRDVVGKASLEQEQADFRPVFIYRYGDNYVYPKDPRTVPVGMKRQLAAPRRLPEIEGNIQYAVGTYDVNDDKIIDFGLPDDYETEVLLTGQFVNFNAEDLSTGNDRLLLFVKGKPFLRLEDDSNFVDAGAFWTDGADVEHPIDGDIAISAYGRVWVTGVGNDYHQIHYSALLDETTWYNEDPNATDEELDRNDAGIIDVREYWPVDGDSIVNIHAHNGFLLVFGRNSILIYANADSGTPAGIINQPDSGIFLQDAIANVGLVRREAICNVGTDVLFVDDTGVRSLGRVIQEKSNPLQEPSLNIRREIQEVIQTEIIESPSHSAIRFRYMPSESIAVLHFASLKIAYVFHLNMPSKTGGLKVTRWTDCFWNDAIELKQAQEDVVFLAGKPTKGLMKYDGYLEGNLDGDPEPYVMRYESMALAIGQSPMQTTIPKSIHYVCMGEFVPGQANALWGFSDKFVGSREFQIEVDGDGSNYAVNEFGSFTRDQDDKVIDGPTNLAGYYPMGGPYYKGYKINTSGSGELFRVGLEVKVQGGRYALQEIDINSAIGRLTA